MQRLDFTCTVPWIGTTSAACSSEEESEEMITLSSGAGAGEEAGAGIVADVGAGAGVESGGGGADEGERKRAARLTGTWGGTHNCENDVMGNDDEAMGSVDGVAGAAGNGKDTAAAAEDAVEVG